MFDTGNTAFMLIATALVMLMTPGLAFFYGGLVGKKNVLSIMMQSFVSMAFTTALWFVCGYSLCFSGTLGAHTDFAGILGNFDLSFLHGVTTSSVSPFAPGIPTMVFIVYQMMFAIITPALISGAFTSRVRFPAYLLFLMFWLLLVYFPFVHMVWGGGLLASWGVQDFAGGIVVHAIAGFAALASVFYVGKRKVGDPHAHNIPFVALGTGLLWFGWFGFNAGSQLKVDGVTALAFLNSQIGAAFAALTWLFLDWRITKKPKFVGLLTGAVAGLATITPAAGYVTPQSALLIGIAAGLVCYFAVQFKNRREWDDALDVWGVHGIGGCVGVILLGVFADSSVNPSGVMGLLQGNTQFFLLQVGVTIGASAYAFIFTYGMLKVISFITPVEVEHHEQYVGLDEALHGEAAYV